MKTIIVALAIATMPATAFAECDQPVCSPKVYALLSKISDRNTADQAALKSALSQVELARVGANETSWGFGVSMFNLNGDSSTAIGAGLAYGLSDQVTVYGRISTTEGSQGAFIGLSGKF